MVIKLFLVCSSHYWSKCTFCGCNTWFVCFSQEIEKSLSSVTVALNNELERRTANIRALLHSNSLPVAIEVNRIAHLEQGSDAVTMPLLAFDIHTNSEQVRSFSLILPRRGFVLALLLPESKARHSS